MDNKEICKQVFVNDKIDIDRAQFNQMIMNDDLNSQQFENRQAFESFQSYLSKSSSETLKTTMCDRISQYSSVGSI